MSTAVTERPLENTVGRDLVKEAFIAGWSAGFQEALKPDIYPHQDRCAVAYKEWCDKTKPVRGWMGDRSSTPYGPHD